MSFLRFYYLFRLADYPKDIRVLFFSRLLLALGWGLSFPFLIVHLTKQGLPLDSVGLLFAILIFVGAIGNLMGGPISDFVGPERVIQVSLYWRAALSMVMAFVIFLEVAPALLMLIYYLYALVGEALVPAADAMIAKNITERDRHNAFSFMRVGINGGWAGGVAIGGFLFAKTGYSALFGLTAACAGISAFVFRSHFKTTTPLNPDFSNEKSGLKLPFFLWLNSLRKTTWSSYILLCLISYAGIGQIFNLIAIYLARYRGVQESTVGALFAVNGILVVLAQRWMTRLLQGRPLARLAAMGLLVYVAGELLLTGANKTELYFLAVVVITLGEIIFVPAWMALSANLASSVGKRRAQATYIGMAQFSAVLGALSNNLLGGYFLEHIGKFSSFYPWLMLAFVTLLSAMGFLAFQKKITSVEAVS